MLCPHCTSHVNVVNKSINKEGKIVYKCPFCDGVVKNASLSETPQNNQQKMPSSFNSSPYKTIVKRHEVDNSMKIASLVMIIIALVFLIILPTVKILKKEFTMYEIGNSRITLVTFCFITALCFHISDLVRSDEGGSDVVNIILMIISFFSYLTANVSETFNGGEPSLVLFIVIGVKSLTKYL